MKTKSIFTLIFTFVVVSLCGQVPQPQFEVTDSTADLSIAIDAVIEDLDLSDVTTNILYDRGWKLGSLENFDGALNADTVRDHAAWLRQYGSLVTAASLRHTAVHLPQALFRLSPLGRLSAMR